MVEWAETSAPMGTGADGSTGRGDWILMKRVHGESCQQANKKVMHWDCYTHGGSTWNGGTG